MLSDLTKRGIKSIPDTQDIEVLNKEKLINIEALKDTKKSFNNDFSFTKKQKENINSYIDKKLEDLTAPGG